MFCIMTMMYLSFTSSLLFFYLTNPLTLGLTLIFHTIFLSLFMGKMMKSFWFIYLLMLVFIGGMLVLFIYVTSIFPNEKFLFNQFNLMNLLIMLILMIMPYLFYNLFFKFNLPLNSFKLILNCTENYLMMNSLKMFNSNTNILLIFMINYLFYCMIIVIKITNFSKGPLRQLNYV
uniref:NADH-ubiquinone oxidoreductase chain 6 n=1 Tax=Polypsocus corruptus TaxID=239259 RepID=A0A8K1ZG63_9NEOP|nr:NADH dehydrogenase subunit 6 [Polypsocus corruptus]